MHLTLSLPDRAPWSVVLVGANADLPDTQPQVVHDPRWHSLKARLETMRSNGRRAVRIVDVNCGNGALLVRAASFARSLGFLAIEAVGVDGRTTYIEDARRRARTVVDLAIGLTFEVGHPLPRLEEEAQFPADIILFEAPARLPPSLRDAVKRAGDLALRIGPSQAAARR